MKTRSHRCTDRRTFIKRASWLATAPLFVPSSVLGLGGTTPPSERIRFGAIGIGNRSRAVLPNFLSFDELRFVAVSDCRSDRQKSAKELIDKHYGNAECRMYDDFRELLAQKDIDAVFIATGNRWHGMASIHAARAGKDIYSEKPVTLTVREGRALVDTSKRFGTIYQAGTQRRSTDSYRFAMEMVRQGKIGRLKTVEMQVWVGPGIPHGPAEAAPAGWNYDMWLGQAPWHPFVKNRVNSWQYFWDTAEGVISDMGCHYTDQMQWVLGTDDTGPIEFEGKAEFPDPAKFMSDAPISGEVRCRYRNGVEGVMVQRAGFADRYIRYIGDEGWIQVDDQTDEVKASNPSVLALKGKGGVGWSNAGGHVANLLASIRSRQPTRCHPEVAHRAMSICQAMNICLRLGKKLRWNPATELFDDADANRMLWREPRAPWRI